MSTGLTALRVRVSAGPVGPRMADAAAPVELCVAWADRATRAGLCWASGAGARLGEGQLPPGSLNRLWDSKQARLPFSGAGAVYGKSVLVLGYLVGPQHREGSLSPTEQGLGERRVRLSQVASDLGWDCAIRVKGVPPPR